MSESRYQTFGRRFLAGVLDYIILLPVSFIDVLVFSQANLRWLSLTWMPLSYSAYWLYSVILHARSGQTVGKRVFDIRVVDNQTEGPITVLQAVMRDSPLITANTLALLMDIYIFVKADAAVTLMFEDARIVLAYATLAWFVLELITCLLNEKRRALHDLIGGTVVVRTVQPPAQTA